ncbi:hypothetical protein ABIB62_004094 [Mucilaginibacter sp. UYP25]
MLRIQFNPATLKMFASKFLQSFQHRISKPIILFFALLFLHQQAQSSLMMPHEKTAYNISYSPVKADYGRKFNYKPVSMIIEGLYKTEPTDNSSDNCEISVRLIKSRTGYIYRLTTYNKIYSGILKITKGENPNEVNLLFKGIKWASNEGDISTLKEEEDPPKIKTPIGIDAILQNEEILIQNTGNSMNHYVKLASCYQKYIRMVKVKS